MDMHDLLILAAHEKESRPVRYRTIPFIDYHPKADAKSVLAPPGSVMVFVGNKGSRNLERIRAAATATDGSDASLADELHKIFKSVHLLSPHAAFRLVQRQPVLASIRYGGRTLATNVTLRPELDTVFVVSPYNGGPLHPDELTFIEHYKEGTKEVLDAVALRRAPNLTRAEAAAVKRVPAEQAEINLAPNGSCCDSVTDIVQVVIAVTFAIMCDPIFPDVHIAEETLKELSPVASAIQLMDIRREALSHTH